jgi:hypothetical protein
MPLAVPMMKDAPLHQLTGTDADNDQNKSY